MAPHLIKLNWSQVALLHQGAGSTIDHFLRLPLEESGRQLVEIDTRQPPDPAMASWLGAMAQVVVVRYLPRNWLGVLAQLRRQGTDLIYLMDDDLLDPAAQLDLPAPYRSRLQERITRRRRRVPRGQGRPRRRRRRRRRRRKSCVHHTQWRRVGYAWARGSLPSTWPAPRLPSSPSLFPRAHTTTQALTTAAP